MCAFFCGRLGQFDLGQLAQIVDFRVLCCVVVVVVVVVVFFCVVLCCVVVVMADLGQSKLGQSIFDQPSGPANLGQSIFWPTLVVSGLWFGQFWSIQF